MPEEERAFLASLKETGTTIKKTRIFVQGSHSSALHQKLGPSEQETGLLPTRTWCEVKQY
jgi:translation initiation factor 1 (eIF-1/SUI1)